MKQWISVCNLLDERELKATFVLDRAYDNNKTFQYYLKKKPNFIIRLKKRKVYLKHKWYPITAIRDSRKEKEKRKIKLMFQEEKECYVSELRVQLTTKNKWINLVLIYGLIETPMMLAINVNIKCNFVIKFIIKLP